MTQAPPPPRVYADWLPLLERFRDGDDAVLPAMRNGTIEWTSVVAERWTTRMAEAFKARLETVSRRLQTALDRSAGDAFSVSRAVLEARRALTPLREAAALSCLPENVRDHFAREVANFASRTQESLESSAKRIRADGGAMLKALRDNPLTAAAPAAGDAEAQTEPAPPSKPGRRVLM